MKNNIFPCLWFDGQAKEAADFYCSIFSNSKIIIESSLVVQFEIEGKKIMGLNGGPAFKINPSISLFVTCQSIEEIKNIWNRLSEGGKVMMPLDKYPWSENYGWTADKFGMTWQLMLGEVPADGQKIIPNFLFVGDQYGKGAQAINYYTSIFPDSKIQVLDIYQAEEPQPQGNLKFGHFSLSGVSFAAMDGYGDHEFKFNEGVSIVVECKDQEEIDYYWNKLTDGGQESRCGWLMDQFGVSWQIVPINIGRLVTDPEKGPRVMQEVMKMVKLDMDVLLNA